MNVEVLQTLSRAFLIAAGALFILSIVLFIVFRIPSVIADLTGISARKGIAAIKLKTEHTVSDSGSGKFGSGKVGSNNYSGGLTPNETFSAVTTKLNTTKLSSSPETTVLASSAVDTRPHEAEADVRLPILEPGKQFKVLKEFSFTSSTEVIE